MPPVEKYIDMGGYALYSRRSGAGKPAVVFESGLGDGSAIWKLVEPIVAKRTSTIIYDRAGLGRSSKATSPRTFVNIVADLSTVLEQLPIEPLEKYCLRKRGVSFLGFGRRIPKKLTWSQK